MPELKPLTALGTAEPRRARLGGLTIAEDPDLALASLALRRDGAAPAPFGLALPGPGEWRGAAGAAAFWTGPGQWMIEAPGRAGEDFAAAVKAEAPGASVTEQTDGWVAFEIAADAGAAPLHALLERLVNLDLSRFGPGSATRTHLEHMSVCVIRRAETRCAILGMRSAAGSLWHALEQAAKRLENEA